MASIENDLEIIQKLEKKNKELENLKIKFLKENESHLATSVALKQKIKDKQLEIMEKSKEYNKMTNNVNNSNHDKFQGNLHFLSIEEEITKNGFQIVNNYHSPLEKLISDYNVFLQMEKSMKLNYIIVKKLEIRQDWLKKKKLEYSAEFFDNLKNLSLAGKLNYNTFRRIGNIIFLRVLEDTDFSDIKRTACQLWNFSDSFYMLYDDSFNNLELCLNTKVTEFYSNYEPFDTSLKPGHICIYLIEKMKYQTSFLDSHLFSIDSKSNSNEKGNISYNNLENFDKCLDYIKSGLILKGIDNYKAHKYQKIDKIKSSLTNIQNANIFVLLTIVFICLSIFSVNNRKICLMSQIALKQNIGIFENLIFYNNSIITAPNNTTYFKYNFTDMRDYLYFYTTVFNQSLNNIKSSYLIVGPIRFRFFRLNYILVCPSKFPIIPFTSDLNVSNICFDNSHSGNNRNKTGVYYYNFSENLNITYSLTTKLGNYDTSGTIVDLSQLDPKFTDHINNLIYISQNYQRFFLISLRGMEISFTVYFPSLDIFITNLILIERDYQNLPVVSLHESIPFKVNLYETADEQLFLKIDFVRIIIIILIFSSFLIRTVMRYIKGNKKGIFQFIKIFFKTLFQVNNILILCTMICYIYAYKNYLNSMNYSSISQINSLQYFQYYTYAKEQQFSLNLEILSLYFISIYSLKYFEIFDLSNMIFRAFQRSYKEYFLLIITITICFLGLTLFTYLVFGQYLILYQSFSDSLLMNIKVFLFSENFYTSDDFLNYSQPLSLLIFVLFIVLIRYFLLFLFAPILIEHYRIESENFPVISKEEYEDFTLVDKIKLFLFPCRRSKNNSKQDK